MTHKTALLKELNEALNPKYREVKIPFEELRQFAAAIGQFLQQQHESDVEGVLRTNLRDLLRDTFYKGFVMRTEAGRYDLTIQETNDAPIKVLFELKRPDAKIEMCTKDDLNKKALQELVYYYMKEREKDNGGNVYLCHLLITNGNEFFLFEAKEFEQKFYKGLKKKYHDFQSKTEAFYEEIAAPAIAAVQESDSPLRYTYFRLHDFYEEILQVLNGQESPTLAALYKLLSPTHLLKKRIHTDPNELDRQFYNELLHILGLEERKEENGGKMLIARKEQPDSASLVEQTYNKVEKNWQDFVNTKNYGLEREEQMFNITLELVITWLNRILFLKLLEAQLRDYSNDAQYEFLNTQKIGDFTQLNDLFFDVLAIPVEKRQGDFCERFKNVPYLNSALFERTELEKTIKINSLQSNAIVSLYSQSVLRKGLQEEKNEWSIFEYLFTFLEAYNFGSPANDTSTKNLINASVLGLIFEKINGHKDGAIFTPSYITSFICRETIRRTVLDKFNAKYNWTCRSVDELQNDLRRNKIGDDEAIEVINSLRICDPAVGSGHFLVSALNELVFLKYDLNLLKEHRKGRLFEYTLKIENDELVVYDRNGDLFHYNKNDEKSQRAQETLFNEKRYLIEHCLFGVDINPTSVQICRLRLWIELLKHAYYTRESDYQALETLPNIDINIKCGNAIVYSLPLQGKWVDPDSQRIRALTSEYYETSDKSRKRAIALAIEEYNNTLKNKLWEEEKRTAQERVEKCEKEIATLSKRLEASKNNEWSAYEPSELKALLNGAKAKYKEAQQAAAAVEQRRAGMRTFEWRLEFPEVWDANGEFAGFDIVLGNPPYIKEYENKQAFANFKTTSPYYMGKMDLWYGFLCVGLDLLREGGLLCFIATNNWTTSTGAKKMRERILEVATIRSLIDFNDYMVFENASIQTMILLLQHCSLDDKYLFDYRKLITNKASYTDAIAMLENRESGSVLYLRCEIEKSSLCKNFTLTENKDGELLSRINNGANHLYESEAINGIHPHYDFVNNNIALKHPTLRIGQGIFGLSEQEKDNLCLTNNELTLIKPYYTTEQIKRYVVYPRNRFWLIYTTSSFKNPDSMDSYPNIKRHLNLFRDVITSDNKPYGLHRARNEAFFLGEKIICQRKCVGAPSFSYADFPTYVSATFYVIKTERFNLKFLTGLLNSKLIAYWLRHKGKMQGSNFQIDKDPLLQIPIKSAKEIDKQIIEQVERILQAKQTAPDADIHVEEKRIDSLVYRLYGLNDSDIAIIENEG